MSLLETIAKPAARPIIATIVGEAGTGKGSLAATFPNPIVIRAEDGVSRQSKLAPTPDAFPVPKTADDVFNQLMALISEDHAYETLVVDSTTALDTLFTADILDKDKKARTLAQAAGGYGAGYDLLAAMHGRVRKAAGILNERKGMNVIFIAHADIEMMRLPDQDDYGRYSLRLSKKAISHFVDNVDLVGYVRLQSALRGDDDDRKKVISNGDREFVCHATAASISKNGLGITEPIDFPEGTNPLAPYLWPEPEVVSKRRRPVKEEVEPEDGE